MSEIKTITSSSRLLPEDLKIAGVQSTPIIDSNTVRIELHVYDLNDNYIESIYALPSENAVVTRDSDQTIFETDTMKSLRELGFRRGEYSVAYNFFKWYLPDMDANAEWYIQDISTSRTEVRISPPAGTAVTFTSDLFEAAHIKNTYLGNKFVLNFRKNQIALVLNQIFSGGSLVFKLYQPLPDDITEKMQVIPLIEVSNPIRVNVILNDSEGDEEPIKKLIGSNKNVYVNRLYESGTPYQSWDDVLSTDPTTSQDLINYYLSSSDYNSIINVDYSNFSNFIHFSSAVERVQNFQYKLQLVEQYSASIVSLQESTAAASPTVIGSITHFGELQRKVLNGFDGYENWLFMSSGSIYSSSLGAGEVTQSTWPKRSGAVYPFDINEQEKTTSNIADAWYINELARADEYDRSNIYNLLNTVPMHIREDDANSDFLLFTQMIGQHFDSIWTYIKYFNQKYDFQHKLNEGTGQDVIWNTLKTFGFDLTNGNDVKSLWKYAFGTDVTGSFGNNSYNMSSGEATKEIWKRLLNNLPYLLKTKGTERGVRALITSYGIPSTILKIREYGGPDPDQLSETPMYIQDSFTYALNFTGNEKVSGSWDAFGGAMPPDSIEFRFNATTPQTAGPPDAFGGAMHPDSIEFRFNATTPQTALLFETNDGVSVRYMRIEVVSSASLYPTLGGTVRFTVDSDLSTQTMSTPELPIFSEGYWGVLLTRTPADNIITTNHTYSLYVKHTEFDRIVHVGTASMTLVAADDGPRSLISVWESGSEFTIGGSKIAGTTNYTGTFQEFRLWDGILLESIFNNHVLAPTSYNGNTYSSSYSDLILRWQFNQREFYTAGIYSTLMLDSNPSQRTAIHGIWSGSNSSSVFISQDERNVYKSPNIGSRRWVSSKVRVENATLKDNILHRKTRNTVSAYDTAPIDLNKVSIFFSPQDIINEDILRTYPDFSIDDFIGSPVDYFDSHYPDLDVASKVYWAKYTIPQNIFTYLKALDYFDKSLFEQVKRMIPARVSPSVGFLIEQTFLERSKIQHHPLEPTISELSMSLDRGFRAFIGGSEGVTGLISGSNILAISEVTPLFQGGIINSLLNDYFNGEVLDNLQFASISTTGSMSGETEQYISETSVDIGVKEPLGYSWTELIFSSSISNNLLTIIPTLIQIDVTGSMALPRTDFWLDPDSRTVVTGSMGQIIYYPLSHWFYSRDQEAGRVNGFYGSLQTRLTTTDHGWPFEYIIVPDSTLVVVDAPSDKSRLKVV